MTKKSVLIIEDQLEMLELLIRMVQACPNSGQIRTALSISQALSDLHRNRPDWVLMDEILGGAMPSSVESLLPVLRESGLPVVLISATPRTDSFTLPPGVFQSWDKPNWVGIRSESPETWSQNQKNWIERCQRFILSIDAEAKPC
jgi:response regulator of citrate/malate metabolism